MRLMWWFDAAVLVCWLGAGLLAAATPAIVWVEARKVMGDRQVGMRGQCQTVGNTRARARDRIAK